jgi:hypothetical protein
MHCTDDNVCRKQQQINEFESAGTKLQETIVIYFLQLMIQVSRNWTSRSIVNIPFFATSGFL